MKVAQPETWIIGDTGATDPRRFVAGQPASTLKADIAEGPVKLLSLMYVFGPSGLRVQAGSLLRAARVVSWRLPEMLIFDGETMRPAKLVRSFSAVPWTLRLV